MPKVIDIEWERHKEANCAEDCKYCAANEKARRAKRNYRGNNNLNPKGLNKIEKE